MVHFLRLLFRILANNAGEGTKLLLRPDNLLLKVRQRRLQVVILLPILLPLLVLKSPQQLLGHLQVKTVSGPVWVTH